MKINEKDKQMFRALNETETGKQLVDYLERLKINVGFLPEDTRVAKEVVGIIDANIIQKIVLQNETKVQEPNPFE